MSTYRIKIDGHERLVEMESTDGAAADTARKLVVTVDGRRHEVDVRDLGAGTFSIVENATARLVSVSGPPTKLTIEVSHPDGEPRTAVAEIADSAVGRTAAVGEATRSGGAQAANLTLKSPIPGKVVKVNARAGDRVKAGQALVVIEAMKMENELRAPADAEVASVQVQEGAAVEAGQELLRLARG